MKFLFFATGIVLSVSLISGCTWVKVSEAGKQVAILPSGRVADCTHLGTITSKVKDSLLGIDRSEEKVRQELDRLAQDRAVIMNANSLVRVSIAEGQGTYEAYNCPP